MSSLFNHKEGEPIPIQQDRPITTQAWGPSSKPIVKPLANCWSSVMEETTAAQQDGSAAASRGGGVRGAGGRLHNSSYNPDAHFFQQQQNHSRSPHLPGGAGWASASGGGGGAWGALAGGGGGSSNRGGGDFGNNKSHAGSFGSGLLGGGGQHQQRLLSSLPDEEDEYDERVEMNFRGGAGQISKSITGGAVKKKTRQAREKARADYLKAKEAKALAGDGGGGLGGRGGGGGGKGGGYDSGGEVDEACVGAIGDEDFERLKFTPEAAGEDGTLHSAYHKSLAVHSRRRGGKNRTPSPEKEGRGGDSKFVAPGLKTPVIDPYGNMPGPVARFHKRQHHHLLRMLGGAPQQPSFDGEGLHLFPPHEIPDANQNEFDDGDDFGGRKKKQKNSIFDNPSSWLLGRDESVEDSMKRHFLRVEEFEKANNNNNNSSNNTPGGNNNNNNNSRNAMTSQNLHRQQYSSSSPYQQVQQQQQQQQQRNSRY